MSTSTVPQSGFEVAPYFDDLLARLDAGDPVATAAFGRHVHWGYWPDPQAATGEAEDYGAAAERLCRMICDAARIRDGMTILDVGCGLGGTIASLNERFHNLDMLGVNLDQRQLDRAAARVQPVHGNQIRFARADACALEMPAATYDAVLAVECIFHFDSRAEFLAGAAHTLKPGGRLALSDFVPPESALEILARNSPANDEATRAAYGQIDVTCTVAQHQKLGRNVGLELCHLQDITKGTMPTYPFLQSDFRNRPDRRSARVHSRATSRIAQACQMGVLTYSILAFEKR